jgi:hypothetical protein
MENAMRTFRCGLGCSHRSAFTGRREIFPLLENATVMVLWMNLRYLGLCQRALSLCLILLGTGKDTVEHLFIDAMEKSKEKILVLLGILFHLDGK